LLSDCTFGAIVVLEGKGKRGFV